MPRLPPDAAATTSSRGRARCGPIRCTRADEVREIFRRFSVQRPEPKGELEHVNAFTLLVAVVLSAQATDAGVNKATPALFAVADTPQKMLALGEEKVGALYPHHRPVAQQGEERDRAVAGADPRPWRRGAGPTATLLTELPGVGRKTANVVLNMAFGQPTMAVDTHIFRIGNRLRAGARQDAGAGRGRTGPGHPGRIYAPRASLADPARPLCLQGAPARMRALHHRRHLQGGGEDQCDSGAAGRTGAARPAEAADQ